MSDDTILPGDPDSDGRDPDMAAAELALGLFGGEERALALRRVLAEPGFAQDVEMWRGHLAQLFDLWPEMTPSDTVFARVERSIDRPVEAPQPVALRASRFWPAATAVASAIAAALLLIVVVRPTGPVPAPVPVARAPIPAVPATILVAAIDPVATGVPVSAVYDPASGGLRLSPAALAGAGRSAELWIIGADATPHSLGLLRSRGSSTFTVAAATRAQLAAGATLAVTLEAVGGSSTGQPQGPIVAKGTLSQV